MVIKMLNKRNASGTLYGVGVGPGDPELMTLKSIRCIEQADIIAIPTSKQNQINQDMESGENQTAENDLKIDKPGTRVELIDVRSESIAWQIAIQAVPQMQNKETFVIFMPMTKDEEKLKVAHDQGAKTLEEYLRQGKKIAFLTLGDPTVYATYMYLHHRIAKDGYQTELISGIPSFCAAAAKCGISLGEQQEQIHIIPASYDVKQALRFPGTKIFMKAGKQMQMLLQEVREYLIEENSQEEKIQRERNGPTHSFPKSENNDIKNTYPHSIYFIENCGMENEHIYTNLYEVPECIGYFAILIIKEI